MKFCTSIINLLSPSQSLPSSLKFCRTQTFDTTIGASRQGHRSKFTALFKVNLIQLCSLQNPHVILTRIHFRARGTKNTMIDKSARKNFYRYANYKRLQEIKEDKTKDNLNKRDWFMCQKVAEETMAEKTRRGEPITSVEAYLDLCLLNVFFEICL